MNAFSKMEEFQKITASVSSFNNNSTHRLSTTVSMLDDRERFILAKKNFDLEQLLVLISSNDSVAR